MMISMLSRGIDIAIIGITRPGMLPDMLPPLLQNRFAQAECINTRADWKQFAELCCITAMNHFRHHDYDPSDNEFKAICQHARNAFLRAAECSNQGVSAPRPSRRHPLL